MALNRKRITDGAVNKIIGNNSVSATAPTVAGTVQGVPQVTDYGQIANKYMKDYEDSKFSYDFNTDPVYQAAKQAYVNQGRLAAKNVAAQAAKFTGGYGNSYGTVAAQQQFNAALENMNDIVPELQQAAYSRYQNDLAKKQNLAQWYLQNSRYQKEDERYEDETAYNRGRDALGDKRYEDELKYSRERDAVSDARYKDELNYSRERDKISDARYKDELNYSRERDKISDARYEDETKYNRETAAKELALKQASAAKSSGGSSGGSSRSGSKSSTGLTLSQYESIRKKCSSATSDSALKSYLEGLTNNGYLSEDVATDFWIEYAKNPYEEDDWHKNPSDKYRQRKANSKNK